MTEQTRTLKIDATRAKDEARTVPATLSTEFPVDRGDFYEVLDHSPNAVDLSRAPLPLIESHDTGTLNIGVVDSLRVVKGKLKGIVKLGRSERAKEVWEDIKAGIVRNLSIGYQWIEHRDEGETIRVTRWMPYELSLVAAPADPDTGFYRSNKLKDKNQSRSEQRQFKTVVTGERERINSILNIGDKFDQPNLAREYAENGASLEDFNRAMLDTLGKPVQTDIPDMDMNYAQRNGDREYSLVNAIRGMIDPHHDNGFEREIGQEGARSIGKKLKAGSLFVPYGALMQRAVTAAVAGTNLIGTEHKAGNFIDVLRNAMVLDQLGATFLPGLQGDVSIPRKTAGSTAYWITGDGSNLTESTPTFDSITLSPKTVGGLITATHKMLVQSDPGIEQILRQDLADVLAIAIDLAAISGSGTSNQPLGIVNTTGIGNPTTWGSATPNYAEVVELESNISTNNADHGNLAYLVEPAMRGSLKTTEKASGTAQYIWEPDNKVNSYLTGVSNQVTSGDMIFGNWSDLLVGMWDGVTLDVDPYTNFASGSIVVRAMADIDIAVRHAQSFALGNDTV